MSTPHHLNRQLHALLHSTGLLHRKAELVEGFTRGRSSSSKDMNHYEAIDMINYLQAQPKAHLASLTTSDDKAAADKMRKKIISLAWQMNWTKDGRADMARISHWAEQYGYLHKPLNNYTYKELPKLLTQFQAIFKSYLKSI